MRQTKPTFRTGDRTNEAVRRLSGRVTAELGRRVHMDDLIYALVAVAEQHMPELLATLTPSAGSPAE